MTRYLWPALAALLAAGLFVALRSCGPEPTTVERRVDSTLASAPAWEDSVAARDSLLAVRAKTAAKLQREVARWQDSAEARLARADRAIADADALAEIPPNITPHDTIVRLSAALEAQKRATALLRTETIPALQATVAASQSALADANATIRIQASDLREAYDRIDRVTVDLDNLRETTKHRGRWNVLGLHLPQEVKAVVLVLGAGKIGYEIGRRRS